MNKLLLLCASLAWACGGPPFGEALVDGDSGVDPADVRSDAATLTGEDSPGAEALAEGAREGTSVEHDASPRAPGDASPGPGVDASPDAPPIVDGAPPAEDTTTSPEASSDAPGPVTCPAVIARCPFCLVGSACCTSGNVCSCTLGATCP
jgi:hypothetical protein